MNTGAKCVNSKSGLAFAFMLVAILAMLFTMGFASIANASVTIEGTAEEDDQAVSAQSIDPQADDTAWYTSPTSSDTYTISNANEFKVFSQIVNGTHATIAQDSFAGKTVKLASSIYLTISENDFSPIGTSEHPFSGTFDGIQSDGSSGSVFAVRGFSMTVSSNTNVGLFGYVSSSGVIQNLNLNSASLTVKVDSSTDPQTIISNVGGLVGCCEGSLINCSAGGSTTNTSDDVIVSVNSAQNANSTNRSVIRNVGGLAGRCDGNVTNCSFEGKLRITSTGTPAEANNGEINSIAENIGGIVGKQGGEAILGSGDTAQYNLNHGNISGCNNYGTIAVTTSGKYWNQRWIEWDTAQAGNVGGVVGYTIGNVTDCHNSANIGMLIKEENSSTSDYTDSYCDGIGGIIGSCRAISVTGQSSDAVDDGAFNKNGSKADELSISGCTNTGFINGYHSPAGIAGAIGSHTTAIKCTNSGTVQSWRWNKPAPGGVIGQSHGTICYCYNRGEVATRAAGGGYGAGYYAAGIVGMNLDYTGANEGIVPEPKVFCCYNTGMIRAAGDYRQGAIAGANDGIVSFCAYLEGTVPNVTNRDVTTGGNAENDGEEISCHSYKSSDLKYSAIALLNTHASSDEQWANYYVPAKSDDVNGGYPVFSDSEDATASADQIDLSSASLTLASNATYSSACAPSPQLTVTLNGTQLVQDVDYKVIPQTDAKDVTAAGSTPYQCTIEGIGKYKGTSVAKANYGIDKTALSHVESGTTINDCTITVKSKIFNWDEQKPTADDISVFDEYGNLIPASEYTFDLPDTGTGAYLKATTNASMYYNVTVTAKDDSASFTGSSTQRCYQIKKAALYSTGSSSTPSATLASVILGDDVRTYNRTTEKLDNQDFTFTGYPIEPVANKITYPDASGTAIDLTVNVDYINIYGVINADNTDNSAATDRTDVNDTASPRVLTIRYKGGGNFTNFLVIQYNIVAADISTCTITAQNQPYSGTARTKAVTVKTAQGATLTEGKDYSVTYANNTNVGTASYTVHPLSKSEGGTGNLTGSDISGTFQIGDYSNVISLGGSDRYETAANEAMSAYPDGADGVIIAYGENYPDALSATSLAGALDYPILLTKTDEIPSSTMSAIDSLGAKKVIIVGGSGVVSEDVSNALKAKLGDSNVQRISGGSRIETSENIYTYGLTAGTNGGSIWGDTAIVATGYGFADALSISPLAYAKHYPIFLTNSTGDLVQSTRQIIDNATTSGIIDNYIVVGGEGVVSKLTYNAVNSNNNAIRLSGGNRYQTSQKIADYCVTNQDMKYDRVAFATGEKFPDALAGSVVQGKDDSVLLLTNESDSGIASLTLAADHTSEISTVKFFGGTGAVSQDLRDMLLSKLGWR